MKKTITKVIEKVTRKRTVKAVKPVSVETMNEVEGLPNLCSSCNGTGRIPQLVAWHNVSCEHCNGTGH